VAGLIQVHGARQDSPERTATMKSVYHQEKSLVAQKGKDYTHI